MRYFLISSGRCLKQSNLQKPHNPSTPQRIASLHTTYIKLTSCIHTIYSNKTLLGLKKIHRDQLNIALESHKIVNSQVPLLRKPGPPYCQYSQTVSRYFVLFQLSKYFQLPDLSEQLQESKLSRSSGGMSRLKLFCLFGAILAYLQYFRIFLECWNILEYS